MEGSLYKKVWISAIIEEVKDFKTFVLEGAPISYSAGQYLTLVHHDGLEEKRRSYSIVSAPLLNEPLVIGVKRMDNGYFSRMLVDKSVVGDELITTGAGGFFTLPDDLSPYSQIFFFAAGSGITPIYSLVKTLLHFHPHIKIVLVYSNASPGKTAFYHGINELQNQFSERFHCEFLFSDNPDLYQARLNRELLLNLLGKFSLFHASQMLFYICGPESYIRMCTYVLQEQGINSSHVRKEHFWLTPPIARKLPPDKNSYKAFISMGKDRIEVDVHFPDTVLRAAKKQNLILPYSCEAGRCGNCVALCTRGKIWHSYNEVLTDKELEAGMVLTCTGHPVGGDVYLQIK